MGYGACKELKSFGGYLQAAEISSHIPNMATPEHRYTRMGEASTKVGSLGFRLSDEVADRKEELRLVQATPRNPPSRG